MAGIRDWSAMGEMGARLLRQRTGQSVEQWNHRIAAEGFDDPAHLRAWLERQGVTGYARAHLVRERFGHPDFLTASADALIDGQYADRPDLRPICDQVIAAAEMLGDLTVQARKTYVSLLTPRRTFARLQPATRARLDVALRLEGRKPEGRLKPSRIHETMPVQIGLASPADVDDAFLDWLRQAWEENV